MSDSTEYNGEDAVCFLEDGLGEGGLEGPGTSFRLTAMGSLYFIFGFITCLNDILVPHLKAVFDLDYTRAMLVQFSFFSAYFLLSLPSGWLVDRLGYQKGMVAGLATMAAGCLLFYPAAGSGLYPFFLGAIFLLAAGITLLQVAANPYVALLGSPETASSRLTLTQGFNSLGTTLAPLFGSALILAGPAGLGARAEAASVQLPYLALGGLLALLAVLAARLPLAVGRGGGARDADALEPRVRLLRHRPMVLGAVAIFLYVGAEVGIGSFLVNYIHQPDIGGISLAQSAQYVSFYWGGAMAGRFLGAAVMRIVPPGRVLTGTALAAAALVLAAIGSAGRVSMWAILAVGLFNAVMFPTIFTLAIQGLGRNMGRASGILCMAVVGGAVLPVAQGLIADRHGIRAAFALPVLCYACIACYGAFGHRAGARLPN